MKTNLNDLEQWLKNAGIEQMNEMQEAAASSVSAYDNIILSAPTGSGKTIAFLSMMLKIFPEKHPGTFALVITPTRELALQVTSVFQSMKTGLKVTACYGGHKREIEENNLIESPALIVGTPGRFADHIRRGNIKVSDIRLLILDEFDKSLEMGFTDEMEFIVRSLDKVEKKILASATPQDHFPDFLNLKDPHTLNFSSDSIYQLQIRKATFDADEKLSALYHILCTIGNRRTIIFVNQKETVASVANFLSENGIYTVSYHGSLEQRDRETAIAKFRNGTSLFLITTDLASRGLDVSNVRFIIHYDIPETEQIYLHRNGRTARMDASGDVLVMLSGGRPVPDFIGDDLEEFQIVLGRPAPDRTEWGTLYISAGKKDKINKIDIVGFLIKDGGLKMEDTGLIEVKDFYSFAAVRKSKMNRLLGKGTEQRIKNKKIKIAAAK